MEILGFITRRRILRERGLTRLMTTSRKKHPIRKGKKETEFSPSDNSVSETRASYLLTQVSLIPIRSQKQANLS